MRSRVAIVLYITAVLQVTRMAAAVAAPRPEIDASALRAPKPTAAAALRQLADDPAIRAAGSVAEIDHRYGVPTFVWGSRTASTPVGLAAQSAVRPNPEQSARAHLGRLAPLYRLTPEDVQGASLRYVRSNGHGGTVAVFRQSVNGVEVFRDELKLLMDRNGDLIAASGYIPGKGEAGRAGPRPFELAPAQAISVALGDFLGVAANPAAIHARGAGEAGYQNFDVSALANLSSDIDLTQPIRIKKVLFHLPDALEPGYYLEVMGTKEAYSYVVSAVDGSLLFRHSLMASDAFSYRVWAGGAPLYLPMDGPQGTSPTPHPTGLPDNFDPPLIAPSLQTLQNGPISTNDPWLSTGSTQSVGNNVDAYADLVAPDGFSAGDLRATTTSANTFDRVYDTSQNPNVSSNQRMASITQLFYVNNFLHDWFYDVGFDEVSGNAQQNNYGRGGAQGDRIHAEAQDYSGTNNANMATPSDGLSPRMQMYVFTNSAGSGLTVNTPAAIAGKYVTGTANFSAQTFTLTGDVVLVNDGTSPTSDGCTAIVNSVAGKIVLIDLGTCTPVTKVQNAQNAGAIGAILVNNVAGSTPPTVTGSSGTITIPILTLTLADGNTLKAQLGSGVNVTMARGPQLNRDGTIDNQVVAHEWGHYISNRLIGDANGLSTQMSSGMGEGWGDFNAMLMTVRAEDALVPSNPNFSGVYAMFGYATSTSITPSPAYYFGFRRVPYSTDFTKNAFTFHHITNGVPLPVGPPTSFGQSGSNNAEVHNTGEVWCTMLWECYASLLRDTGRLTFDQARDRMRSYVVTGYKLTPNAPTFTEARDAILAAALANDPTDFDLFCQAFARRGAGTGAVSPDRYSFDNSGVVESYACGGDLAFVSATVVDDIHNCDADGYLDNGETGHVLLTLRNSGATNLTATTATVSSTNPAVSFPAGTSVTFASTQPFANATSSVPIRLTGAVGQQVLDLQISYNDPGLLTAGPRLATVYAYGNVDETPTNTETVEPVHTTWTMSGNNALAQEPWRRIEIAPNSHRFYAPDPGALSDQYLISPPLQVAGSGTFTLQFQHAYKFETDAGTFYDGGVLELSNDGGNSWTDIGSSASPGYGGNIFVGANNPLSGRPAFVNQSPSYPSLNAVTVNLGSTYNGQTVQVRFRLGSDEAANEHGWEVDNFQATNILNVPFLGLSNEPMNCTPLAVDDPVPTELSFSVMGPSPARGEAGFQYALPAAGRVQLSIYDVSGRKLAILVDGDVSAGTHTARWNATTGGEAPRTGVYFARLVANGQQLKQRLVVVQ